jgi:hypothetical protein
MTGKVSAPGSLARSDLKEQRGNSQVFAVAIWQILYYNPRNPAGQRYALHIYVSYLDVY